MNGPLYEHDQLNNPYQEIPVQQSQRVLPGLYLLSWSKNILKSLIFTSQPKIIQQAYFTDKYVENSPNQNVFSSLV
jgi:hypothetical protein